MLRFCQGRATRPARWRRPGLGPDAMASRGGPGRGPGGRASAGTAPARTRAFLTTRQPAPRILGHSGCHPRTRGGGRVRGHVASPAMAAHGSAHLVLPWPFWRACALLESQGPLRWRLGPSRRLLRIGSLVTSLLGGWGLARALLAGPCTGWEALGSVNAGWPSPLSSTYVMVRRRADSFLRFLPQGLAPRTAGTTHAGVPEDARTRPHCQSDTR